ncbi:MAG: hypothetical protein AAFO70_01820 [Pseudomonadota bacterium]
MTVICPACDARFRDPPADISPTRPLQCGKCEHEWHRPVVDAPLMMPSMDDLTGEAIRTQLPVVTETRPADAIKRRIYVDALPQPKKSRALPALVLGCSLALTAVAGMVGGRGLVVDAVPQSANLYAALGMADETPQLQIANVTTTRTKRDGISQLIVRGEVANIADATVPVPPIVLTMRGKGDAKLYEWRVMASARNLASGEKSAFTAVATDYPAGATDVDVTFEPKQAAK